ncbi:MAG TPA: transglycosylase SLT domain-containing protein [Micromonosporaceae bacterium]
MSRLWSRFGVRALAVLVLLLGAGGGYLLGEDRQTQQELSSEQVSAEPPDPRAEQKELQYLKDRHAAEVVAEANRRAAQLEAARKAAAAAKAEAERARRAEAAASRKKERDAAEAAARAEAAKAQASAKPYDGPIPASCNEYSGNREIGCALLLDAGFAIDQMPCLDKLWTKESGWNTQASNPSGAYGIPQALPGSKMATVGDDWETNPATQIKWGLGYIKDRYGTPCDAWAHSQNVGWY